MMADGHRLNRRQFAKGVGVVSIGAAAGCLGELPDPEGAPERPSYGADPDQLDPVLKFVVLSVHYQNLYFDRGDPGRERPQRPAGLGETDRELRFILDSLDYQNAYIQAEAEG